MSTKRTKRAGKNTGGLSDLSPKAGRPKAVKGGAVNAFVSFFDKADGESIPKTTVTRPPSVR